MFADVGDRAGLRELEPANIGMHLTGYERALQLRWQVMRAARSRENVGVSSNNNEQAKQNIMKTVIWNNARQNWTRSWVPSKAW